MQIEKLVIVLLGIVSVAAGVLIILFREKVAIISAHQQRGLGAIGRRTAQNSTPAWWMRIGIAAVLIGILIILAGIFGTPVQGYER